MLHNAHVEISVFSVIQILRETNIGESKSPKTAFCHFWGSYSVSNFTNKVISSFLATTVDLAISAFRKCKN